MPETATLDLDIRRFEPDDAEAVLSLHFRAIEEVGAYSDEISDYLDRDLSDIDGYYLRDGGEFLVGTLEDRVVAMGAIKRVSDEEAELKYMRVEPEFQRRGLGRVMLRRLEERAVELGFIRLKLDTTVGQTGAQRMYEGAGYSVVGEGRIGPFDCLFYEKDLSRV